MTAPVAALAEAPLDDPTLSSPSNAPTKLPMKPPTTGPTIGPGTPMKAPRPPPGRDPHPARREPPYFRAYFPDIVNSIHAAMRPRTVIATSENQLIGEPPTS